MAPLSGADDRELYRRLGEIGAAVEDLRRSVDRNYTESIRRDDETKSELRTVKHDQRGVEQKVETIGFMVAQAKESLETFKVETKASIQELKEPVEEILALRSRAIGMVMVIGTLGSLLLYFLEPIWRWAFERMAHK